MLWVGTSGYSYPEWKGSFYPEKISGPKMFAFYAQHFRTVEINNTFYRMPDDKLIRGWLDAAPDGFIYVLKAPQRITHVARLRDAKELVDVFFQRAFLLADKLGPILFQLPPFLKKDAGLLRDFVDSLPQEARVTFEFRNTSWFSDDVYAILEAKNCSLCIADSEKIETPFVPTANFGYLRLRDEGYIEGDLKRFAKQIQAAKAQWKDTFVFFKHEEQGKGPAFAKEMIRLLG